MATRQQLIASLALFFALGLMKGCDAAGTGSSVADAQTAESEGPEKATVTISGEKFRLEVALDDDTRYQGLSNRLDIPADGGMLFVFPDVQQRSFVMRDCPNPIDIAFLDGSGRVVAIHQMQPEEPRGENESAFAYEQRLKKWPSWFGAQFAVETAGGRLEAVGLKVGDQVRFDVEGLKARAR